MSDVNAISFDKLFSPSKLGSFKREFAKSVGRITLEAKDFAYVEVLNLFFWQQSYKPS